MIDDGEMVHTNIAVRKASKTTLTFQLSTQIWFPKYSQTAPYGSRDPTPALRRLGTYIIGPVLSCNHQLSPMALRILDGTTGFRWYCNLCPNSLIQLDRVYQIVADLCFRRPPKLRDTQFHLGLNNEHNMSVLESPYRWIVRAHNHHASSASRLEPKRLRYRLHAKNLMFHIL